MIREIEELSMSAWPALQTHLYDGWVLRVANGYTKRANSVNLLYPSTIDLSAKINYCEDFYKNLGLPVVFKITSETMSDNNIQRIDNALNNLGYIKIDETSVRVLDLNLTILEESNVEVEGLYKPTNEWIEAYTKSVDIESDIHKKTIKAMLNNILGKTIFITVKIEDKAIGFGYGVIDNSYVGIFDIHVDKSYRGYGYGKAIMNKILNESKQLGATKAYLQVVVGNTVAENLYNGLGFEEIYRYWYRKL